MSIQLIGEPAEVQPYTVLCTGQSPFCREVSFAGASNTQVTGIRYGSMSQSETFTTEEKRVLSWALYPALPAHIGLALAGLKAAPVRVIAAGRSAVNTDDGILPRYQVGGSVYVDKIQPFTSGYSVRAVVWWQGGHDATTDELANAYEANLRLMIAGWRQAFGSNQLAFYIMELDPRGTRDDSIGGTAARQAIVRAAGRTIANDTPYVYFVETSQILNATYEAGFSAGSDHHSHYYDVLGYRVAEAIALGGRVNPPDSEQSNRP